MLRECLTEAGFTVMVVEIDLLQVFESQTPYPRPIVECLGHNISRCPITFEFKHMDTTVGIEGEKIYVTAIRGMHLPTHDKQVDPSHARVLGQHVLEPILEIERR